jgi:hypothetical protein
MTDILMSAFVSYVIPLLGSAIMALGTYGLTLLNNKLKNEQVKHALEELTKVTISVVQALNQTDVVGLRDNKGKLSEADRIIIKNKALCMIKSQMQITALETLAKNGIDVEERVKTEIESQVWNEKVVVAQL